MFHISKSLISKCFVDFTKVYLKIITKFYKTYLKFCLKKYGKNVKMKCLKPEYVYLNFQKWNPERKRFNWRWNRQSGCHSYGLPGSFVDCCLLHSHPWCKILGESVLLPRNLPVHSPRNSLDSCSYPSWSQGWDSLLHHASMGSTAGAKSLVCSSYPSVLLAYDLFR